MTKTCIDHIIINNATRIGAGVIRQKLADHCFVTIIAFGGGTIDFKGNKIEYQLFVDNRRVDDLMKQYDCNCLLKHDHLEMYDKLVNKTQEIYIMSGRSFRLKQRSSEKRWTNKEKIELFHEKDVL